MATEWVLRHPQMGTYWDGRYFTKKRRAFQTKRRALTAYDKHVIDAKKYSTPLVSLILEEVEVTYTPKHSEIISPDNRVLSLAAFEIAHAHNYGACVMYQRLLRMKGWQQFVVMAHFKTKTPYEEMARYKRTLNNLRISAKIGFYHYSHPTCVDICFKSEKELSAFTMIEGSPCGKIDLTSVL
jgi:hypothetical protein